VAESKGTVDPLFTQRIRELADQSKALGASYRDGDARTWQVPEEVKNTLDIPGITEAFARGDMNDMYEKCIADATNPGTVGDVVSMKTQIDYIANMERGFRARHATPIRCLVHAAARRIGHGHPQGVLIGGVLKEAQDAITAGQVKPS
jgi:hypothetical protein